MKIEKLTEGMLIKNYKELCALLDLPVKGGNAKKAQLKEIECFCRLLKQGNKFIVEEVYNMKMDKVDKRKDAKKVSNNSKYSNDIQALIIDLLAQAKGNCVELSTNVFLRKLDMINDNFIPAKNNIIQLSELTNVSQEECFDYFDKTHDALQKKLETALNGLRRRALVIWEHSITVCVRVVKDKELNQLLDIELPRNSLDVATIHKRASEGEKEVILIAERSTLDELSCSTLKECYLKGLWSEFRKRVNQKILKAANIEYYYKTYNVVFNPKYIEQADKAEKAKLKLKKSDKKIITDNLNNNVSKLIHNNAKTLQRRTRKKDMIGSHELIYLNEQYVGNTDKLTDVVVKKGVKKIKSKLIPNPYKQKNQVKQMELDLPENDAEMPF